MGATRFFVANLPPSATEKQLTKLFQDYGGVERVELKTKDNPFEPENVKVIAFVTLQIHPNDIKSCVDALNWEKINGIKIKVSVAKESFLERLKRERDEAGKGSTAHNEVPIYSKLAEPVLQRNAENTRKIFTEEELATLENDDNPAADLLISKKRAASSLYNGKIVIQSFDTTPLHVIDVAKKHKKNSDGKKTVAEQKRKESQNKMTKQYKDKKSAIQHALSGLDATKAKKIKFDDAEEEYDDDISVKHFTKEKSKMNIFGSESEDNEEDGTVKLKLKPELYGKKGAKLVKMQSRQSLDPRFRIDANFVDDDADDDKVEEELTKDAKEDDERTWQMGILEQVVGTKLDSADGAQRAARKKRMLRYDPAKEDHQKLLRTSHKETSKDDAITTDSIKVGKKQQRKQQAEVEKTVNTANAAPTVSKEVFYVVTDTLAESLKTRGEGFSLLNMFGGAQAQDKRADELKKVADSKILVNKLDKHTLNPFKYDSSSDEGGAIAGKQTLTDDMQQNVAQKKSKKQKNKIVMESFFIPRNDARLKEGAKFFRYEKQDASVEEYEAVRNRLKLLIRSKINKTKKKLEANGGVGHKRRTKARH
ncbi:probable RNA-binding protein CG14230 [Eurosta solidaginis]|uniref:probable RNA-binding protein CG14230 n=1 Tax=Eurosta solidaginis TaxID=178769 RepID=UPI00353127F8